MSTQFGPAARRLAGATSRLLGWRPQEFWDATPAELAAILAPDPDVGESGAPLSRAELNRLMEHDDGRSG